MLNKTILIIEDELDIRAVYSELLTDSGYTMLQAADGDQGISMATTQSWDLMLLDIMLPKKDGLEILTNIKGIPELAAKPVILLSNLEKDTILTTCMELGANSYLIKSNVTPAQVIDEVAKYLPLNDA